MVHVGEKTQVRPFPSPMAADVADISDRAFRIDHPSSNRRMESNPGVRPFTTIPRPKLVDFAADVSPTTPRTARKNARFRPISLYGVGRWDERVS